MVQKQSAGILLYKITGKEGAGGRPAGLEVFLVHPGGPWWKNKDAGAWTIPKGELIEDETALQAALREFAEETGHTPAGPFIQLEPIRQKGGKQVHAWAAAGELDPAMLVSNQFEMEWPPSSGRIQSFPEINKGGWFDLATAAQLINPGQVPFLKQIATYLRSS